jgi:hypothetical protein
MSNLGECWSCKKTITDEKAMLSDGPFEGNLKHDYCSVECWIKGK